MEKYMMKVDRCCCCFDIRTGTKILTVLGLVSGIIQLVKSLGELAAVEIDHSVTPAVLIIVRLISYYSILHYVVFCIIPYGLGVHAVFNNKPSYLKPYIFVSIFEILGSCIICLIVLLMAVTSGDLFREVVAEVLQRSGKATDQIPDLGSIVTVILIIFIIMIFLNWYFLSVVYMCYKQMKEGGNAFSGAQYGNVPPEYNAHMKT